MDRRCRTRTSHRSNPSTTHAPASFEPRTRITVFTPQTSPLAVSNAPASTTKTKQSALLLPSTHSISPHNKPNQHQPQNTPTLHHSHFDHARPHHTQKRASKFHHTLDRSYFITTNTQSFRLRSYQTQSAVSHSELRSQVVLGRLSTSVGDQLGTAW